MKAYEADGEGQCDIERCDECSRRTRCDWWKLHKGDPDGESIRQAEIRFGA